MVVLLGGMRCSMMSQAHLLCEMVHHLLASIYGLCHEVREQAGCFMTNDVAADLNTMCSRRSNKLLQVITDSRKNTRLTGMYLPGGAVHLVVNKDVVCLLEVVRCFYCLFEAVIILVRQSE